MTGPMRTFPEQLQEAIDRHRLLPARGRVLVALSGGADSVALLLGLLRLGYEVEAAHCNFHLRGDESRRDEDFVRELCRRVGVRLHCRDFDTRKYARAGGVSIEMAARQLRYEWFDQLAGERAAAAIAVAHHREDNVETLLLNLVRGTGLRGLAGMLPRNGKVVRPMLDITRGDIKAFLRAERQDYVTDSSNLETVYKRNKVRLELLPLLRELNPDADRVLAETQHRLADAGRLYAYALERLAGEVARHVPGGLDVDVEALRGRPAPQTLFYELLRPYGFPPRRAEEIYAALDGRSGTFYETEHYTATLNRGCFEIRRHPVSLSGREVRPGERLALPDGRALRLSVAEYAPGEEVSRDRRTAWLDFSTVRLPLTVRSVRTADRFAPFGMKRGTKLVSDFLTDRKRSVLDKRAALVLCDADGIVWLVGEIPDRRCAVTEATSRVLRIEISEQKDNQI